MKLIVNADDFGLTKGVTLGIIDALEKGIVTETTAMVRGLYLQEGMKEAIKRGIENIGLHLTFTWNKPVLSKEQVPSLVDENGNFYTLTKAMNKTFSYEEVRKEAKAQMESFLSFGIKPTHIDGHHHFFAYDHKILDIVLELAKEYNLSVRCPDGRIRELYKLKGVKTTEAFAGDFYEENVSMEKIKEIINKYKDSESLEIMCHPAYVNEELMRESSYNIYRGKEFDILTSQEIKDFLKEKKVELVGYKQI